MSSHWHAGSVIAADSQDTCQYRSPRLIHWAPLQVAHIGFGHRAVVHPLGFVTTPDGVLDQQIGMQVLTLHDAYILSTPQQRRLHVVAMPVSTFYVREVHMAAESSTLYKRGETYFHQWELRHFPNYLQWAELQWQTQPGWSYPSACQAAELLVHCLHSTQEV